MLSLKTLLPFAFFAIVQALPPAGTYNIVSRVSSAQGQLLAVTFRGEGDLVTLQPLATADKDQIFNLQVVVNPGDGMSMVSEADPSQRIAPISNSAFPSLLSSQASIGNGAFFNIISGNQGFSIGGAATPLTTFWVATAAIAGAEVSFVNSPPDASNLLQFWELIPNSN